jgi:3-demethoxyubiquinol 3-hydroxylase
MKEIERILRLNQAGEYGAIRIYSAQLLIARAFYMDIVPKLEEMILHEIKHFEIFSTLLVSRSIGPFSIIKLWGTGGFLMGLFTALIGRKAIWICTDAVETTVLNHLEWQLMFLEEHDPEVHAAVVSIIADEEAHQEFGQNNSKDSILHKPIFFMIKKSTEFAIQVSAWL